MTNPNLSIAVSDCSKTRRSIGRVYQKPGMAKPYNNKMRYAKATQGLLKGDLFPSITNIIDCKKLDLSEWKLYMMHTAIYANWRLYDGSNLSDILRTAKNASKDYTEATQRRGNEVHQAAEDYAMHGIKPTTWEHGGQEYFEGVVKFIDDFRPEFIAVEKTVYGETKDGLGYAGTIDFIARINGRIYAGDWKTSKEIHNDVGLQLAAGIKAHSMITDDGEGLEPNMSFDGAIAVHLGPDGYSVYLVDDVDHCWQEFSYMRNVWNWVAFGGEMDKPILSQVGPFLL